MFKSRRSTGGDGPVRLMPPAGPTPSGPKKVSSVPPMTKRRKSVAGIAFALLVIVLTWGYNSLSKVSIPWKGFFILAAVVVGLTVAYRLAKGRSWRGVSPKAWGWIIKTAVAVGLVTFAVWGIKAWRNYVKESDERRLQVAATNHAVYCSTHRLATNCLAKDSSYVKVLRAGAYQDEIVPRHYVLDYSDTEKLECENYFVGLDKYVRLQPKKSIDSVRVEYHLYYFPNDRAEPGQTKCKARSG